jgi:hypothetical protein
MSHGIYGLVSVISHSPPVLCGLTYAAMFHSVSAPPPKLSDGYAGMKKGAYAKEAVRRSKLQISEELLYVIIIS